MANLPTIKPLGLTNRRTPFDHPDWQFELKYDGFRALLYLDRANGCRLVSHNGLTFAKHSSLADAIASELGGMTVIRDGEIVAADATGR